MWQTSRMRNVLKTTLRRSLQISSKTTLHVEETLNWKLYAIAATCMTIGSVMTMTTTENSIAYCDESSTSSTTPIVCGVDSIVGDQILTNWSDTHRCSPPIIYEPKTEQEVLRLLQNLQEKKQHARPIGTALSPNGIGMSSLSKNGSLISLIHMDQIHVNPENKTVTVGGGARVSEILKELKKFNLTLANFSSIQEQQISGWTQVSAHGTGVTLPTVDEMILRMKIVTPSEGILTLSSEKDSHIFDMMKVGLGSFGVVTELTLNCVPSHELREMTASMNINEIWRDHYERLRSFRHIRYMWMPFTTNVTAVVSNPSTDEMCDILSDKTNLSTLPTGALYRMKHQPKVESPEIQIARDNARQLRKKAEEKFSKLVEKQVENTKQNHILPTSAMAKLLITKDSSLTLQEAEKLSFSQLRDRLLDIAPLDRSFVESVNRAEAEYWKNSSGIRVADSTEILGFDCGGQQLVCEVCFPIGPLRQESGRDIEFILRLLDLIDRHNIAAPCPIEQRWTSRSKSPMSPAYSADPDTVFCWVGIIMYLPPSQTSSQREEIKKSFAKYVAALRPLLDEYDAHCHWAKIEKPLYHERDLFCDGTSVLGAARAMSNPTSSSSNTTNSDSSRSGFWSMWHQIKSKTIGDGEEYLSANQQLDYMRNRIASRYPTVGFNAYRSVLDPNNVLTNDVVDTFFKDNNLPKKQ